MRLTSLLLMLLLIGGCTTTTNLSPHVSSAACPTGLMKVAKRQSYLTKPIVPTTVTYGTRQEMNVKCPQGNQRYPGCIFMHSTGNHIFVTSPAPACIEAHEWEHDKYGPRHVGERGGRRR